MFSKRSIRSQFLLQLIIASAVLLLLFSSVLYMLIKQNVYDEKQRDMLQIAKNISTYQSLSMAIHSSSDAMFNVSLDIVNVNSKKSRVESIFEYKKGNSYYLVVLYPFEQLENTYIEVTKEITQTKKLLNKILSSIFIINAIGFIIIIIYAIAFSKMLVSPIRAINRRLSNMNEHLIRPLDVNELPDEFKELGKTINHLLGRIQNFVKYQKELFIGAAHELKTPLAVIKLKNQVVMIKRREAGEYIAAIKQTNESVDEMNKIVSDILNIGREEGAQLELPVCSDVMMLLKRKADDFALLAKSQNIEFMHNLNPASYSATIQPKLLNQILQNFLQNALKFTNANGKIEFNSWLDGADLVIEVVDEGCGIDESEDLFAPFKRFGNKSGVGLGLFLAKSAADALGADIALRNRDDSIGGTVASLRLHAKMYCSR